ncbi:putative KHG/KDPG aldolase [Cinnamomum micranthum f. kanehirae]|uniref:Putative KHG/KDPG aldolase n=1 Tax=Cinnamomum micranthum f. kanehirae TaxID=337451 RepID=A0A3S3NVN7_9MAGN|nr:putative KHG/KDPG aldolase [Cinnamomum micranthum f. kanehirae]
MVGERRGREKIVEEEEGEKGRRGIGRRRSKLELEVKGKVGGEKGRMREKTVGRKRGERRGSDRCQRGGGGGGGGRKGNDGQKEGEKRIVFRSPLRLNPNCPLSTPMATGTFSLPPPSLPRSLAFRGSRSVHFSVCHCFRQPSLSPLSRTLSQIENSGVIACLRAERGELAVEAARAALRGGISVLEVVMSTPSVFEVIQALVSDHPTSIIGAGTVLNAKDARKAIQAGAKFLMSPVSVKEILDDPLCSSEVLYIPGVMTPTEVMNAYNAGAKIVKVYPISALGGAQYISAIKKPFSHVPMVASQGITIDLLETYIIQGASAVVLSDAIFNKEAMNQRNFDAIQQLAYLSALRGGEAVESEDFFIIIISPQKYTEQSGDAVQSGDDVDQRLTSALSKPC